MSDKTELLPCPFCGGKAEKDEVTGWVACATPRCMAFNVIGSEDDWNRRTAIAHLPAPAAPVAQEPVGTMTVFSEGSCKLIDFDGAKAAFSLPDGDHQLYVAPPAAEQPDYWAPPGGDYDRSIHCNPDAKAWADFFVATYPALTDKHDLMLGWFANAMMAMHDFLKSDQPNTVIVPKELLETLLEEQISALGHTNTTARKTQFLLAGGAE